MSLLQGFGRQFIARCSRELRAIVAWKAADHSLPQYRCLSSMTVSQYALQDTSCSNGHCVIGSEVSSAIYPKSEGIQRSYLHTSATVDARPRSAAEQRRPQIVPRPAVESAVGIGTIYVQCTKNNTICTLVDMKGMPLAWTSAGSCGFKNSRKKSTQVSQQVAETLIEKVLEKGFKDVRVVMKGLGYGKQSAVRAITKSRLRVLEIHEQTAIPHNGCRAPKRRRI